MVGDVQQLRVLQLLAEPLQQAQGLVESHRHRDSGQVFADVVVQDGHDADVAVVRRWCREGGAATWVPITQVASGKTHTERGRICLS